MFTITNQILITVIAILLLKALVKRINYADHDKTSVTNSLNKHIKQQLQHINIRDYLHCLC